ncbi:MAG: hypothetical protein SFY81_12185 [Verrucomicrobiota bacterium]|nr:hypothetical protein [Verrucomicrobiota bacterium]
MISQIWKAGQRALFAMLLSGVATTALQSLAVESKSRDTYQSIIDRNPFGLKPPAPPPAPPTNKPPEQPAPPKVDYMLSGISTYGTKRAYLVSKDPNNKYPYMTLSEGQQMEGVEVLEIDEKKQTVKIRNTGSEILLSFATHGVPVAKMAPVAGPGGRPGPPGSNIPTPVRPGGSIPLPGGNNQGYNPGGNINTLNGASTQPLERPLRTIPSRNRGPGLQEAQPVMDGNGDVVQPTPAPSDPDVGVRQYIDMRIQERNSQAQGQPFPPLPDPTAPPSPF